MLFKQALSNLAPELFQAIAGCFTSGSHLTTIGTDGNPVVENIKQVQQRGIYPKQVPQPVIAI